MAEYSSAPTAGTPSFDQAVGQRTASAGNQLITLTNAAGAMVSLALVVGIGIWGYKLLVRDVSGIPVVRAASGEMRIRPEEPGGELASHQGLSVNTVAAEGTAAKPADRLILAPKPLDLTEEDQIAPAAMVAEVQQDETAPAAQDQILQPEKIATALENGNVEELVAQLTAGVAPIAETEAEIERVVATVAETVVAEVSAAERQVAALLDAPGVRHSVRPRVRPTVRAEVTPAAFTETPTQTAEVDPASLPAGTRLAQLGAFDSPEVARQQWDQLMTRFDTYLAGKTRVVQEARSGGRTFYRLRAMGFEDIADARRFCSALVAENQDCIPVVTR